MLLALAVGLAASLGAASRYLVDRAISARHRSSLPWGTFVINISGSLLLGLVDGLAMHHGLASSLATVIGVGFAGGYTTWSTFTWEALSLARDRALPRSLLTVGGSLVVGLAAAAAGFGLALL